MKKNRPQGIKAKNLKHGAEMSHEEVAYELGVSPSMIRKIEFRAFNKIRKHELFCNFYADYIEG